jgi:hypothetical protein
MSSPPVLASDAAMVLGIASTAMPFARTPEAEAERWLRLLRVHGEVGVALQELGVSDGPLGDAGERASGDRGRPRAVRHEGGRRVGVGHEDGQRAGVGREDREQAGEAERDAVAAVAARAVQIAAQRGADGLETTDILIAVMYVYGEDFERVLRAHGTDGDVLRERLGVRETTQVETPPGASDVRVRPT